MAAENSQRDENRVTTLLGVTDDSNAEIRRLLVDASTGRLKVSAILSTNLEDLSDVTITSIASGEILKWNGSAWINNTLAEAGIGTGDGDVSKVGTPVDNQIGVWTGDGTIEGTSGLTYDGSNLLLTGDIGITGTRITKGWFTDLEVTNAIAGSITGTSAVATTVTVTDNESTAEENVITFVAGAAGSGNVGLEADGDLTYNPSTGKVTATGFVGALTGNADTVTDFTPASGSLTLSGADALTLTTSAATNVTLPTTGTLLANVVEDTTPQLGGQLDVNGNSLGDGTLELLSFSETGSAVNEFTIANAATNNSPELQATGSDADIDIELIPKGTGIVKGELKRFMVQLLANDTDQSADTTIQGDFRISNRAITVKAVGSYCDTAGTTGVATIDINEAGTTILSTKITIDSTEKSSETAATPPVISDSAIAADAIITFDIDGVHTTEAKGLKVWVDYNFA